ncbi:MAG: ATP-binding cassette domain-containing protein [Candidatus Hodarchaeota archaeon]
MTFYEGEFVVVLGPSGSGKTTLLNQIGGIDTLTEGTMNIHGKDITGRGGGKISEYRRSKVAWIIQFF